MVFLSISRKPKLNKVLSKQNRDVQVFINFITENNKKFSHFFTLKGKRQFALKTLG